MRQKPLLPYSGITVVLSNPSRFDTTSLLSGVAGFFFDHILKPLNRFSLDIRTLDCKESYEPNTRVVLICGAGCLGLVSLDGASLDNHRGSPIKKGELIFIPTYLPQDCVDRKNYEASLNPLSDDFGSVDDDTDSDDEGEVKDRGRTSRRNYRFWFEQDIRKAIAIAKDGYHPNVCNYKVYPSYVEFKEWCATATGGDIFLDIETNPLTQQMLCFTVSRGAAETITIPLILYNGTLAYDSNITCRILRELCGLFARNTVVIHNALFDLFILLWKYKIPPPDYNKIKCTMVIQHRLFTEAEKSLGHCISQHTHERYHKDEGVGVPMSAAADSQLWLYNAKDVERLALVYYRQMEIASSSPALLASIKQGCESLRVYLTMMYRGIRLDNTSLCAHIDALDKREQFFESRVLPRLVGYALNPRSPLQVANYLYNELRLPKPKDDITNKKNLFKLALSHDIPSLKVILALRKWRREKSQISFNQWQESRVTTHYKVTGTKTLRLSSSALLRYKGRRETGYGTNLQNWRKDKIRYLCIPDIFVPSPLIFIQCDEKGAEALIVAYECEPGNRLRDMFTYGVKPHTYVAIHLFPKHWMELLGLNLAPFLVSPIADVPKLEGWRELSKAIAESDNDIPPKRYYYMSKQTVHSSNYDIKGPTFVMNVLDKSDGEVVIPLREGNRFLTVYHELIPEIKQWHLRVREQLKTNRTICNTFGYPRKFYGQIDFSSEYDSTFKEAYAQNPQSTVGTITNIAATELQALLDNGHAEKPFAIMQNNHDSLLVQCRQTDVEYVARTVQKSLERELVSSRGEKYTMRSEVSVGNNWKEMKEITL